MQPPQEHLSPHILPVVDLQGMLSHITDALPYLLLFITD